MAYDFFFLLDQVVQSSAAVHIVVKMAHTFAVVDNSVVLDQSSVGGDNSVMLDHSCVGVDDLAMLGDGAVGL
ncbi:hypothetical protein HKB01_02675, partial [Vibrio parahaemolyticus]|nr:hypothetical protein [Vibrio parahaemolyticus]